MIRKGLPIIDERIRGIKAEIQEKAKALCKQVQNTEYSEIGKQVNNVGQDLSKVVDPIRFEKEVSSMLALCKKMPEEDQGEAYELLEKIKNEQYVEDKLPLINMFLSKISTHMDNPQMLQMVRDKITINNSFGQMCKIDRIISQNEAVEAEKFNKELLPVLLGVSAPRAVKRGNIFIARFVAYIKSLEKKVEQQLSELSHEWSESYMGVESCRWKLNTNVTVKLSGRFLKVNPSKSDFIWNGKHNLVNFTVEVPDDALAAWTVLHYEVFIDEIRVAFIPLDLEITSNIKSNEKNIVTIESPHTAFASYASLDISRVYDRVASIRISAGFDIFLDCLSRHPGEDRKKKLESEIKKRDIFMLFWSKNAKKSRSVRWEWKTALVKKEESAIQLHPLQTITEASLPKELKKYYVEDLLLVARNYNEGNRKNKEEEMTEETDLRELSIKLKEILESKLILEELRDFCFEINLDYENIRGETKSAKIREILIHLEQRDEIERMELWLRNKRPDINIENLHKSHGIYQNNIDEKVSGKKNDPYSSELECEIADIFKSLYQKDRKPGISEVNAKTLESLKHKLHDLKAKGNNINWLDMGCGDGRCLEVLDDFKDHGNIYYHGIDISHKYLDEANKRAQKYGIKSKVEVISTDAMKFDSKFDLVSAVLFLHEVDPLCLPYVIRNMLRALKSDGTLVISDFEGPYEQEEGVVSWGAEYLEKFLSNIGVARMSPGFMPSGEFPKELGFYRCYVKKPELDEKVFEKFIGVYGNFLKEKKEDSRVRREELRGQINEKVCEILKRPDIDSKNISDEEKALLRESMGKEYGIKALKIRLLTNEILFLDEKISEFEQGKRCDVP